MNVTGLRVAIADDHPVFRDGLQAALEAHGAEVVGTAADGESIVALVVEALPDVVVMDLDMPTVSGIEATARIAAAAPSVRVLVVTMHEDDAALFEAMRAGAAGYVSKSAGSQEILSAVTQVATGGLAFGPDIARRVQQVFSDRRAPGDHPFPSLTARELEVLGLLADGLDNAAIANRLAISPKTAKNHVSNIFTKLCVADRAEAIIRARDAGFGSRS